MSSKQLNTSVHSYIKQASAYIWESGEAILDAKSELEELKKYLHHIDYDKKAQKELYNLITQVVEINTDMLLVKKDIESFARKQL